MLLNTVLDRRWRIGIQKKMADLQFMVGSKTFVHHCECWNTALDSEAAAKPVDPLASLEKTAAAKTLQEKVVAPRIEELYDHSERVNSDPYTHSKRIRKLFREEKKIEKAKEVADNAIKDQFALPRDLKLIEDKDIAEEAKEAWKRGQSSKEASSSSEQTFAQVRQAQIKKAEQSVSRQSKSLSSHRQASTLGAVLLRNTLRSTAATKKVPQSTSKPLGIIKR